LTCSSQRQLASEALGTALLVATVVGSGIMAEKLAGGSMALALLCNTIPTGAILYVLITMLGPVSAHFNPAVSLVFAIRRELPWTKLAPFVLAQVLGGVVGTLLAYAMFDQPILQVSATARTGLPQWVSEAVATFTLVLTILGTIRARPDSVPVSVALAITAAYWFTASTSFANPAVTIARALSNTFAGIAPGDVPAFIVSQLLGAVIAMLAAERVFGWQPRFRI
jgi:glycerol uptake facilitator-like aquaporin